MKTQRVMWRFFWEEWKKYRGDKSSQVAQMVIIRREFDGAKNRGHTGGVFSVLGRNRGRGEKNAQPPLAAGRHLVLIVVTYTTRQMKRFQLKKYIFRNIIMKKEETTLKSALHMTIHP